MFRSRSSVDTLFELIAKKKYSRAIAVVRSELEKRPDNPQLRMQLADLLVLEGQADEASRILARMAHELATGGFVAKAIAVLKKMQRIDPDRPGLEDRLARLIKQQQEELSGVHPAPTEPEIELAGQEAEAVAGSSASAGETDRAKGLDRSALFEGFSAEELAAVIRGLDLSSFDPGTIVFTEGEPGDSLMVLAGGCVRVFVRDGEGRNHEVRQLGPGEVFGEISLLTEIPRTATITAAEACEVLELDRAAVGVIAKDHPRIHEILRELCLARAGSDEEMALRAEGETS